MSLHAWGLAFERPVESIASERGYAIGLQDKDLQSSPRFHAADGESRAD
jgi:hypothetical protein